MDYILRLLAKKAEAEDTLEAWKTYAAALARVVNVGDTFLDPKEVHALNDSLEHVIEEWVRGHDVTGISRIPGTIDYVIEIKSSISSGPDTIRITGLIISSYISQDPDNEAADLQDTATAYLMNVYGTNLDWTVAHWSHQLILQTKKYYVYEFELHEEY